MSNPKQLGAQCRLESRADHGIGSRKGGPPKRSSLSSGAPDGVTRILKAAVIDKLAFESRETSRASARSEESNRCSRATDPNRSQSLQIEALAARSFPEGGRATPEGIPLWKRVFDIVAIAMTWPVWLPLMVAIMLGIKFSSPGPLLYRQERVGLRGRRFMIFKFRTMKVNVETGVHETYFQRLIESDAPMTKLDSNGDSRLIRCGRFLRAAGLDELPQLFNVLRGEMSLVGPRPCTVQEFDHYLPWQRERVNASPGLTGYWQVNGKNKTTFSEMVAMDIFYGTNMSLAFDLKILLRTVPAVVRQIVETRGYQWPRWTKPAVDTSYRPMQHRVDPGV